MRTDTAPHGLGLHGAAGPRPGPSAGRRPVCGGGEPGARDSVAEGRGHGGRWERRPVRPRKSCRSRPSVACPRECGRPSQPHGPGHIHSRCQRPDEGPGPGGLRGETRGVCPERCPRLRVPPDSGSGSQSFKRELRSQQQPVACCRVRLRDTRRRGQWDPGRHRSAVGGGSVRVFRRATRTRQPFWSHGPQGVLAPEEGTCTPGGWTGL